MPSHLRIFLLPILVFFAGLAFSILVAYRYSAAPSANLGPVSVQEHRPSPTELPAATAAEIKTKTYTDPNYGFAFDYPDGLLLHAFNDQAGYVVLAEQPNANLGFQIFVRPFDEIGITSERIQQELPNVMADEGHPISIGPRRDIPALLFSEHDTSIGTTTEVWFVWPPSPLPHGNYLYQVTTYGNLGSWLLDILATWRFEK